MQTKGIIWFYPNIKLQEERKMGERRVKSPDQILV